MWFVSGANWLGTRREARLLTCATRRSRRVPFSAPKCSAAPRRAVASRRVARAEAATAAAAGEEELSGPVVDAIRCLSSQVVPSARRSRPDPIFECATRRVPQVVALSFHSVRFGSVRFDSVRFDCTRRTSGRLALDALRIRDCRLRGATRPLFASLRFVSRRGSERFTYALNVRSKPLHCP